MSVFDEEYIPRRVVTGVRNGRSIFLSDGPAPNTARYPSTPGFMTSVVYTTAAVEQLPVSGEETAPVHGRLVPAPGETSLLIVTFPPDSVFASPSFDGAASAAEQVDYAPDFAATFDPDSPGKHQTDSIDYDIVLDGEIWLELDEETRHLKRGDVVVQGGARHAWRNKGTANATLCFVLIGARTDESSAPGRPLHIITED